MLISRLSTFPAISALQVADNFKRMILIFLLISIISVVIEVFLSFVLNFPTGATIVLINGLIFTVFYLLKKLEK